MSENKDSDKLREALNTLLGGIDKLPEDCVVNAIINDQRLVKLAEYDVSSGYTNIKVDPELIQARFAEFKNIVLKKSSTLAELETTVFSRWGVLEQPRINSPTSQTKLNDIDVKFAEVKPITGFSMEPKTKKGKGNKNG